MARQLDDKKRKMILGAAKRIFGEHGFGKTTVKQIARLAKIAPGTLYTYFENKEALFSAVVEDVWIRFETSMKTLTTDPSTFFGRFVEFIDYGFGLLEEVHPLLRGMFSEANKRALLVERVDEICEYISTFLDEAMASGIVFGPVKDPEIRRFNLRIMISGIMFRAALAPPKKLKQELNSIKKGLVEGLRQRVAFGDADGENVSATASRIDSGGSD